MKLALPALVASIALSTPVWAQQKADEHAGHHAASSPAAATDEMTDAEVRKAMLGLVKAGDKVKFKAVNEAGKFTVTDLKVVR